MINAPCGSWWFEAKSLPAAVCVFILLLRQEDQREVLLSCCVWLEPIDSDRTGTALGADDIEDELMQIAESFKKSIDLFIAHGFANIRELPGCAELQVNDCWWIAINGHQEKMKCSKGPEVPPFQLYVEYCGWPAGFIGKDGGVIAAGAVANEDLFIGALDEALSHAPQR